MSKYKCIHCNQIVERKSNKQWIPSYCETTGKDVRLQRVKENKTKKRIQHAPLCNGLLCV